MQCHCYLTWTPGHQRPILMVWFTFTMQCHLISFRLPCAVPGNEECTIYKGWVKTPVLFSPVCGPKFTEFSDDIGDPLYLTTPLAWLSVAALVDRCQKLAVSLKCWPFCMFATIHMCELLVATSSSQCRRFLAINSNFWGRDATTFVQQIVSTIYCPPFGKVWLSSVCSLPAKPSNELECRIYVRWVKMTVQL